MGCDEEAEAGGGPVWHVSCWGLAFAQDLWELSQLLCTYQGDGSATCLQGLPLEASPLPLSPSLFPPASLPILHPAGCNPPLSLGTFGHPHLCP